MEVQAAGRCRAAVSEYPREWCALPRVYRSRFHAAGAAFWLSMLHDAITAYQGTNFIGVEQMVAARSVTTAEAYMSLISRFYFSGTPRAYDFHARRCRF